MKIILAPLPGARKLLGWIQKEMVVAETTVADLIEEIPLPPMGVTSMARLSRKTVIQTKSTGPL